MLRLRSRLALAVVQLIDDQPPRGTSTALAGLIARFRRDLDADEDPFVVGIRPKTTRLDESGLMRKRPVGDPWSMH